MARLEQFPVQVGLIGPELGFGPQVPLEDLNEELLPDGLFELIPAAERTAGRLVLRRGP